GSVIKGWIPALLQMKEGMRAKVVIPSNMAYGFYGTSNPDVTFIPIPSYTTLVFEIEVKEVRKIE
ncbi:MAG: FKBP-type peptidyl-prolyl cis-trans isomerase, partial [Flavobacteriaceae bacterium]|nr:FKBP-type peptidyl-prolyl cis-trans isomerase [Flavobacteriaceae bacterium]